MSDDEPPAESGEDVEVSADPDRPSFEGQIIQNSDGSESVTGSEEDPN